jgi:hypothetical protein
MREPITDYKSYIQKGLAAPKKRERVMQDFTNTFLKMGVSQEDAQSLSHCTLRILEWEDMPIAESEAKIFEMLSTKPVSKKDPTVLTQKIDRLLKDRAKIITAQVLPHLQKYKEFPMLDFGAGDGKVTKALHISGYHILGVDVKSYGDTAACPDRLYIFDGLKTEFNRAHFSQSIVTNVLHHAANNESCIAELSRITRKRLVVIETVPEGQTEDEAEADRFRTFMNDYFYNRLLHDPSIDVPVPGTYETAAGWKQRFEPYGWRCTHEKDLGYDIPAIADRHHLLVFDR